MKRTLGGLLKNKKGFTAVELVVTMVIGAILAGALTVGVMAYVRYAQFNKENEYAQTLYLAAQTELTRRSQRGALEELETLTQKCAVPLGGITTEDGNGGASLAELIYQNPDKKYQGTVCYLTGTAADYAAYLAGTADAEIRALYDIFSLYLYDKDVLNATVCLEFDPAEGQVYSVLYSDKCGESENFSYDGAAGSVNISNRRYDVRKSLMLGYYGVDTLSKATSTKVEKPVISNVALHNEGTLNLTFRLSKVPEAVGELQYEIQLFDAGKNELLTIQMNRPTAADGSYGKYEHLVSNNQYAATDQFVNYTAQAHVASCTVTRDGESGTYLFPAWIDKEGTVTLVLDAVDFAATEESYQTAQEERRAVTDAVPLDETFSLHRFGIDADSVYCTIKGAGANYKTTALKQSNAEDPYFGGSSTNDAGASHKLYNARHLYNVRFSELETGANAYRLTVDFSWTELLESGAVYCAAAKNEMLSGDNQSILKTEEATPFPMITELKSGNSLTSAQGGGFCIDGLTLTQQGAEENTGLFRTNSGSITSVQLDKITVTGGDKTGAFCGTNQGTLGKLTVLATGEKSSVTGTKNVGGIFGYDGGGKNGNNQRENREYSELVNHAAVTGETYVGGITGRLYAQNKQTVTVRSCENYGRVSGTTACIGGIVGYCGAKTPGNSGDNSNAKGTLSVSNCVSSMRGSAPTADALQGYCVGGIVGLSQGAKIQNCNTKEGYLSGEQYVGGLVGLSVDGGTISADQTAVNQLHVAGKRYVGGIVGANAEAQGTVSADQASKIQLSENTARDLELANLVNRGVVVATEQYGGGITGYNTGEIIDCTSDTENSDALKNLDGSGDYIGGVAGYNNYQLIGTGEKPASVISAVFGKNYVGGVVGYNDVNAVVSNYTLSGGYVSGECFVGGFAGVNLSENLFQKDKNITANPNQVKGTYCVGGIIGGNILNPNGSTTTTYNVQNFLGSVEATAFAGGFIGYQLLSTAAGKTQCANILAALEGAVSASAAVTALHEIKGSGNNTFIINGTDAYIDSISAQLYVGGVLGYNADGSRLYIKNVVNRTVVTASGKIVSCEQGEADVNTYSYAGGIIGKVSEDTVIENCSNAERGKVTTAGTYTGGIAEINAGVIYLCKAESIGDYTVSHLGGVTGVNLSAQEKDYSNSLYGADAPFVTQGSTGVYDCAVSGTITGNAEVGGIAAVNQGLIWHPRVDGGMLNVNAAGDAIGGVAGLNAAGGTVVLEETLQVIVSSADGTAVGGVIGENRGVFSADTATQHALLTSTNSAVTGKSAVGGLVGLQSGTQAVQIGPSDSSGNYYVSGASVTAAQGYAGGIVGRIAAQNFTIHSCINVGAVQATLAGSAGGITAETAAGCGVTRCINGGNVSAANGSAGGITAENAGTVSQCSVKPYPVEDSTLTWLEHLQNWLENKLFTGRAVAITGNMGLDADTLQQQGAAGGIAAHNAGTGTITGCSVTDASITNPATGKESGAYGGVAGRNDGQITLGTAETAAVSAVTLAVNSNYCAVGGAVGLNRGRITGSASVIGMKDAPVQVSFASAATVGSLGGAVGINLESAAVTDLAVYAKVTGDKGDSVQSRNGYGGVAGVNSGKLERCSFDGSTYADGNSSLIANVGGTAGLNTPTGVISDCAVGTAFTTVIQCGKGTSAYGFVGGMIGLNQGALVNCDNFEKSKAAVSVLNYAGHTGGLVGRNNAGASVTGTADKTEDGTILRIFETSTGKDWTVLARYYDNDCGSGGIMGYSASGANICYVKNYAKVYHNHPVSKGDNVAVGGFIGRLENGSVSTMEIRDCENHGEIYSNRGYTGGFIGVLKFNGCTMENCVNYADAGCASKTVKAEFYTVDQMAAKDSVSFSGGAAQSAAGLIARVYSLTTGSALSGADTLSLENCVNHGAISGRAGSAGMIGTGVQADGGYVYLTDCVNTGCLSGSAENAGIVSSLTTVKSLSILRCRNYGLCTGDMAKFSGIVYGGTPGVVRDCFDCSNAVTPICSSAKLESGNYYISQTAAAGTPVTTEKTAQIESFAGTYNGNTTITAQSGHSAQNAYDGNAATQFRSNMLGSKNDDSAWSNNKTASLTYTLQVPTALSEIEIVWGSAATTTSRDYTYTLSCQLEGGTSVNVRDGQSFTGSGNQKTADGYRIALGLDADQKVLSFTVTVSSVMEGTAGKAYIIINELRAYTGEQETTYPTSKGEEKGIGFALAPTEAAGSDGFFSASYTDEENSSNFAKLTGLALSAKNSVTKFWDDTQSSYQAAPGTTPRYQLYYTLEEAVARHYGEQYFEPGKLSVAAPSDMGDGAYLVTWTSSKTDYAYEVSYQISEDASNANVLVPMGTELLRTSNLFWTLDLSAYEGKYLTVGVRAVYFKDGGNGDYQEAQGSDAFTQSAVVKIKMPLPAPKVHLELVSVNSGYAYRAVLENQAEITEKDPNAVIQVGSLRFAASAGASAGTISINSSGNQTLIYWAEGGNAASDYGKSATRTVQTRMFSPADLKGKDYCNTSFDGFYGNTFAGDSRYTNLYYQTRISYVNTPETYYYIELVATDDALGVPVALASSEAHVTDFSGVMTATFAGLPASLTAEGAAITVRSFPWRTQAYMSYFGHTVAENLTAERVRDLHDGDGTPILTGGQITAGYDIQKNVDGTYTVLYSIILANGDGDFEKQIDKKEYAVANGSMTSGGSSVPVRPAPVIEKTITEQDDQLVFTWNGNSGEEYWVTLVGINTVTQQRTELSSTLVTGGELRVTEGGSWNYNQMELTVERIGVVGSGSKTTIFPSSDTATLPMELRLAQIPAPAIALYRMDGAVQKDSVLFDISWPALSNENQKKALAYYQVTISAEGGQKLVIQTNAPGTAAIGYEEADGAAKLSGVDLNAFAAGTQISVSVQAVAKPAGEQEAGGTLYKNGAAGVAASYTLPARCTAPDMNSLTLSPTGTQSMDGFAAGISLSMPTPATSQTKYQIAVQVYQSYDPETGAVGDMVADLATKEAPATMTNGVWTVLVSTDYAGYWLRVVMRETSTIQFSSVWTDEAGSGAALTEQWLRLPVVRLNAPANLRMDSWSEGETPQAALHWSTVAYAECYELCLTHTPTTVDAAPDAAILTLQKSGDGYTIQYQGTGGVARSVPLRPGETTEALASWVPEGLGSGYALGLYLALSGSGNEITLVLPASSGASQNYNVTLRALPQDTARYAPSPYTGWRCLWENGGLQTTETTFESVPSVDAVTLLPVVEDGVTTYSLTCPYQAVLHFGGTLLGMPVTRTDSGSVSSALSGEAGTPTAVWLLTPPWGIAIPTFTPGS